MFGSDFVKTCNFQKTLDWNICQVAMGYWWLGCLKFLWNLLYTNSIWAIFIYEEKCLGPYHFYSFHHSVKLAGLLKRVCFRHSNFCNQKQRGEKPTQQHTEPSLILQLNQPDTPYNWVGWGDSLAYIQDKAPIPLSGSLVRRFITLTQCLLLTYANIYLRQKFSYLQYKKVLALYLSGPIESCQINI